MKRLLAVLALLCSSITAQAQFTFGPKTSSGGGGATVTDTVRMVTFDSVRAVRIRADTLRSSAGASKRLTLQTTTSGSAVTTALRFNELQQSLFVAGTVTNPAITFAADTTLGMYRIGVTQLGFTANSAKQFAVVSSGVSIPINGSGAIPSLLVGANESAGLFAPATNQIGIGTAGAQTLVVSGGASATLTGGAGSMTVIAGTGNSRQFTAQTTTSGGTATTFLRANEVQQSLFANGAVGTPGIGFAADTILGFYRIGTAGASDTLAISANGVQQMKIAPAGILRLPILPAEGATKNAMCWDGATFNVTQNAAATCTVSSRRFKTNIRAVPLDTARTIVSTLHASMYDEKVGGRKAFGIIAEEADSANHRLASRDAKGLVTSTNYEEITAILLAVVKDQQRVIDSLRSKPARTRTIVKPAVLR